MGDNWHVEPDDQISRAAHLDGFWRGVLRPSGEALQAAADNDGQWARSMAAARLLEACAWLGLFIDARLVPLKPASTLVDEHIQWLVSAYDIIKARRSYFFNERTWVLLESLVTEKNSLHTFSTQPRLSNSTHPRVQEALPWWMATCWPFILDDVADTCVGALSLMSDEDWTRLLLLDSASSTHIFELLRGGDVHTNRINRIMAGFVKTIRHMHVVSALADTSRVVATAKGDIATLRMAIGDVHYWRLNFSRHRVDQRFDALAVAMERLLRNDAFEQGAVLSEGGFAHALRALKRSWISSFGPISIAAGQM